MKCEAIWEVGDWGAKFSCERRDGHKGDHRQRWEDSSYDQRQERTVYHRVTFAWSEPIRVVVTGEAV